MAEVNSSGCFFFCEPEVSNHIDRRAQKEQSREKTQYSQSYFSGDTQEEFKIRMQHENKLPFQIQTCFALCKAEVLS